MSIFLISSAQNDHNMLILWIILGTIGGILTLMLMVAALSKKSYALERTIVVNKNKADTFYFVTSLQNQDRFSKWANLDPAMKKEYVGIDRSVGFISKWESTHKQVGQGEQEITNIVDGERMECELRFLKPMRAVAQAYFTVTEISENQTKVTWGFTSRMPYPFNIFLIIMNMEKMLGNDFEEGLVTMKRLLETV
jgi:Polyketide cyclase / dehydrase and lipid transport